MPGVVPNEKSALIIVDVQLDFCPGGAVPVPEGDLVVPILNRYIPIFQRAGSQIVATRDWHPPDHISFTSHGGTWPAHCVKNSSGASFHSGLALPRDTIVISKGDDPKKEAYSGFQGTRLSTILHEREIENLFVGGLATDYCVRSTVEGALALGFKTFLLSDASRGVDISDGDSTKAVQEMIKSGAEEIEISSFP